MCNGANGCPLNATDGMPAPKVNNTTNTLSAELVEEIGNEAKDKSDALKDCRVSACCFGFRDGYYDGATAYAPYKEKYEQVIKLYENCFKEALRSSRAFTEAEIESHWNGVKEKYNL